VKRTEGSRSTSKVPRKLANRRPVASGRKKGAGLRNRRRETQRDIELDLVSTGLRRIANRGCISSEAVIRGAGCSSPARPDLQGGPGRAIASVYPTAPRAPQVQVSVRSAPEGRERLSERTLGRRAQLAAAPIVDSLYLVLNWWRAVRKVSARRGPIWCDHLQRSCMASAPRYGRQAVPNGGRRDRS